jgi:hypothetical protein
VEPGATIVRLEGESKEEVIQEAMDRALRRVTSKIT